MGMRGCSASRSRVVRGQRALRAHRDTALHSRGRRVLAWRPRPLTFVTAHAVNADPPVSPGLPGLEQPDSSATGYSDTAIVYRGLRARGRDRPARGRKPRYVPPVSAPRENTTG